MLFLFIFMPAMVALIQGAVCGIIGYVWHQNRWVEDLIDYLANLISMALQVAVAVGVLWLYGTLLGWPEPE